jgi:flagellin
VSLVVNTNIGSLNAQRSLASSSNQLNVAMERLSSGKKINSASDDAAGFAIAERMTAQVRGLNMAVKNASDSISLLDTAQAMLEDQSDIVQRIRELAVQAANDTNSAQDREYLQAEAGALVQEVDRIRNNTRYNGETVTGWKSFQVGTESGQNIDAHLGVASGYDGSIFGQATQDYAAGSTVLEIKGLSKTGPFEVEDVVIAGLYNPNGYYVQGVTDAVMHDDGTFTQTITLATGITEDISGGFEIVVAVGQMVDGAYVKGGRGSLYRIDLVNDAAATLEGIDSTLETIASLQSTAGTLQNRFDFVISNLMTVSEFTTAARSRIQDADFAAESARLAKAQVLQQTGAAMAAQANSSSQLVLSLIR